MSSKLNETIGLLIQRNEHTGEERESSQSPSVAVRSAELIVLISVRHELFPDEALAVGRADEWQVV